MPCTSLCSKSNSTLSLAANQENKPLVEPGEIYCDVRKMQTATRKQRFQHSENDRQKNGRRTTAATPKGSASVILQRSSGIASFGLGIAGGSDKHFPAIVSCMRPGSIAHRSDGLQVADIIVAVNGIKLAELTHDQILTVLRNAGCFVRLDIEYDLNDPCFEKPASTLSKATDVYLEKEGGSFGFTMRGGSYGPDTKKSRPLTVTNIRAGGPSDREGRLRVGDRILSIDGIDVYSATLQAASKLLSASDGAVCLTVEYDVSILEVVKTASGPLLLEIDKPPGLDLGVSLSILDQGAYRRSLFIENIVPASIADRCGALHVGDQLLSVDGMSLEFTTLAEASKLLRGSTQSNQIKLEIIPYSQMNEMKNVRHSDAYHSKPPSVPRCHSRSKTNQKKKNQNQMSKPNINIDQQLEINTSKQPRSRDRSLESAIQSYDQNNDYGKRSNITLNQPRNDLRASTPSLAMNGAYNSFNQSCYSREMEVFRSRSRQSRSTCKSRGNSGSLSASVSGAPCRQVCHSEVMEVMLNSWSKGGFGLILHRGHPTNDQNRAPLFISYIERGSAAEKSGVLQVGDRILAVNDWCTANGTAEEANYVIKHAASPMTLTVEFDVIETVLPSSGLFTVKLAKRGQNLGIVMTSSGSNVKGEPVIVSDIRTGSVAHRCGSVHPGDQLLAIDNIPLDTCTVEEAVRLLQRSSDIVKLRVKKNGAFLNDEAEAAAQTVVYSVELSRRGGPLGITIASTEERGDPVIISQLAPHGLADRTGALHVGDRILAINGQSLNGKRVSEAMQMLQAAGDSVTLKIARCVEPYPYQSSRGTHYDRGVVHSGVLDQYLSDHDGTDKLGTPVQSIDSAVESLEDSPIADSHQIPCSSNRHSQNSKSSSLSGGGDAAKYVEELSVSLQRSLTTLKNSPVPLSTSNAGQRNGDVGSIGTASSTSHAPSDQGLDSGLGSSEAGGDQFCGCLCQQQSGGQAQEEWMRVLEALETVGEAEMLKKLEETIMSGAVPQCDHVNKPTGARVGQNPPATSASNRTILNMPFPVTNTILRHPHMGNQAARTLSGSNSSLTSSGSGSGCHPSTSAPVPPPKPPPPIRSCGGRDQLNISTVLKSYENIPYITSPVQSSTSVVPDRQNRPSTRDHL